MKVYQGLENFKKLENAVVTIGTFDGVHVGHQRILERLKEISIKERGETVVITFWPHPRYIIDQNNSFKLLSTIDEKSELLIQHGVEHIVRIPFTKEFSQLTSEEFIQNILVDRIGTKKLVIGYDHKFGKNREGDFEYLTKNSSTYGFEVEEIPEQDIDNVAVSSTKVRKALETGDLKVASEYLGRNYSIKGLVVKGKQLGRTLGYPTANLVVEDEYKLIPSDGIYAVEVKFEDKVFGGMLSIGYNPTVGGTFKTIEVNIFDFNQDVYSKYLTVYFKERLRNEEKFDSIEALKVQLAKDKVDALNILKGN